MDNNNNNNNNNNDNNNNSDINTRQKYSHLSSVYFTETFWKFSVGKIHEKNETFHRQLLW